MENVLQKYRIERKFVMKNNKTIFATLMSIIGIICTAIVAYMVWKEYKEEGCFFKKLFKKEEDDLEYDCYDEEFMEEEDAVEEHVAEEEEEKPIPKARRGYFPLKFPVNETV